MSGPGENVAVVLTPPGAGAIAVVRLAGPANATFAAKHLTRPPRSLHCVYCDLRDGNETIDDVIVVQTAAGHLDLNVHAGPWVIEATLRLATAAGYRVAPWTQHPAIAIDADDPVERQMLIDLPAAKTPAIVRALMAQPAAWRAMLGDRDPATLRRALDDRSLAAALAVPTVAIVGTPNAGKSTLANALFAQQRSITADVPGTTRDWVGELADVGGVVVRLIDTPGVRETADPIEAAAIERAGAVIAAADCVVLVLDGSRPLDPGDRQLLDASPAAARLVVRSKADLPRQWAGDALDVSATTGAGLDTLRGMIRSSLGIVDLDSPHARCWTADQRRRLAAMLEPGDASI